MHNVSAYLEAGIVHSFEAEDGIKAREIANRIITEGLWVKDGEKDILIPIHRVFKVVVEPKK